MKKLCLSILASLALTLGLVSQVQADEYLRIGMEAAYAPFNWTQDDDSNGAVKIDGDKVSDRDLLLPAGWAGVIQIGKRKMKRAVIQ